MIALWLVLLLGCQLLSLTAFVANLQISKIKTMKSKFLRMEIFEGNPFGKRIWDEVWKLPVMQTSPQGVSPTKFGDAAQVLKANILQIYGGVPSVDGAPVAQGEVEGLLEGSLFLGLRSYYEKVILSHTV